jgi:hypothetical protein
LTDETAQRKLQRIFAEYAIARVEHQIACSVLSNRPQPFGQTQSAESVAEQVARERLLSLHDQMTQLEADCGLDAADPVGE